MLILDDSERDGWRIIAVAGELDVVSAPQVRSAVMRALSDGVSDLVLDLGRVEFIDSFGLGVLVGALKRVRAADGRLKLVVTEARVQALFKLTGLESVFDLVDTVDAALAK